MAGRHEHQRPRNARDVGDGLKLHRRVMTLSGHEYTVVTLRPGTVARFSTNRCHDVWHILSDPHGAALLARLAWGLAYERPDTIVLVDRPFIVPNPFDAARSASFVLVARDRTPFGVPAARDLAARLPLDGPNDGTVRWRTFGLDGLLDHRAHAREVTWGDEHRERPIVACVRSGLLVVSAPPPILRRWAYEVARLDTTWDGTDYTESAFPDLEVQVFLDYRRRLSVARRASAEVIAGAEHAQASAEVLEHRIWQRGGELLARSPR